MTGWLKGRGWAWRFPGLLQVSCPVSQTSLECPLPSFYSAARWGHFPAALGAVLRRRSDSWDSGGEASVHEEMGWARAEALWQISVGVWEACV